MKPEKGEQEFCRLRNKLDPKNRFTASVSTLIKY